MKTRKVLAAATLAALPLFAGAMHPGSHPAAADAARGPNVTERSSGPRVLYWAGVEGQTAVMAYPAYIHNSGLAWFVAL